MKAVKRISFVIAVILTTNVAFAQLQFGLITGIGGATQSVIGNIYDNDEVILSYNIGLTTRKPISEAFAIKANLIYTFKGRFLDVMQGDELVKQKNKFSYLELPVKVEYYITLNKKDRLFVGTGPYVGLLLDTNWNVNDKSTNINNETKDFDFGLAYELGYSKIILKKELQFSISYDMGFIRIAEYDENIWNKSLTFNVAFLL